MLVCMWAVKLCCVTHLLPFIHRRVEETKRTEVFVLTILCMHTHVNTRTYTYTYTHIRTPARTHSHTHAHTGACTDSCQSRS